jgi:hypothetical protein
MLAQPEKRIKIKNTGNKLRVSCSKLFLAIYMRYNKLIYVLDWYDSEIIKVA